MIKEEILEAKSFFLEKNGLIEESVKEKLLEIYEIEHQKHLNKFGQSLIWATKLIYFFDPIELIPCGIPEEEYDIEAKIILDELEKIEPKLEKIIELIYNVFEAQFGKLIVGPVDRPCYTDIAKELLIYKKIHG